MADSRIVSTSSEYQFVTQVVWGTPEIPIQLGLGLQTRDIVGGEGDEMVRNSGTDLLDTSQTHASYDGPTADAIGAQRYR